MHYIRYTHILSDLVIYYAYSKPISARITLFFLFITDSPLILEPCK